MIFIWPAMLLLLVLVPILVLFYRHVQRQRAELLERHKGFGLLQGSQGALLERRRHIPPLIFLIGITVLLLAVARPEMQISLPRIEGTVILVFDVSGSMKATDVEPNRLELAKSLARDFVERQPNTVQIGVVVFSDGGFSVQAPTNDQDQILTAISRIGTEQGTSLGQGILAALNVLAPSDDDAPLRYSMALPNDEEDGQRRREIREPGSQRSSAIVMFTDGENTGDPDPIEVATFASEQGVRVYPVGVGTLSGIDLEVEGFIVHTQLDDAMLQQIAEITAGSYFHAEDRDRLQDIYDAVSLQLTVKPEKTEVTAVFAGIGVFFLVIGALLSLMWFNRVP
jgi:Mg-chelatase subunit ChlD